MPRHCAGSTHLSRWTRLTLAIKFHDLDTEERRQDVGSKCHVPQLFERRFVSMVSLGVHSSECFDASGWLRCTWACIFLKRQHVERWLCVFGCPTGGGETGSSPPSPPATSALAAASSEEEGLHARPLPHNFREYIFDVAVYFGRGRIAHRPSSSHSSSSQLPRVHLRCRCVLRRRKDCTQSFFLNARKEVRNGCGSMRVSINEGMAMKAADAIGPAWDLSKAAWSSASAGKMAESGIHHPSRLTLPPVLGLSGVNLLLLIRKRAGNHSFPCRHHETNSSKVVDATEN